MRPFKNLAACMLVAVGLWGQSGIVTSIQNPASNIPASLPNGGIAQGSIFVFYGVNLGPGTLVAAPSLPLPSTAGLGGMVVTITVGTTTVTAPLIYTVGGAISQTAAVLPSNTPAGSGMLTATYIGKAAAPFPITVVKSNFGISTVNQTGGGAPVVTDASYKLITASNSAIPGTTYVVWGTGLGPANSDDNIATDGDLGTPIQVWVGGISANVVYRGRSAGPGLDQINFTVPDGLVGCEVSLAVQAGAIISNYTVLPVAPNGGACSDPNGVPPAILGPLLSKSGVSLAAFTADQNSTTIFQGNTPFTNYTGKLQTYFANLTKQQINSAYNSGQLFSDTVSSGSCIVAITLNSVPAAGSNVEFSGLNAGSTVTVTPPSGTASTMSAKSPGVYQANPNAVQPAGFYKETNSGGPQVGPMTVTFTIPPYVSWTNQNGLANSAIDRTRPLTITWIGGDPTTYVDIQGNTGFGGSGPLGGGIGFECVAPSLDGRFTVPTSVLLALPAEPGGSVQVASHSAQQLTVPGMDFSYADWTTTTNVSVSWK